MTDFEIVHEILLDIKYNGDQLLFELELNKIQDPKLRLGLLFELFLKPGYEADNKKLIKIISLYLDSPLDKSIINDYHQYFLDNFVPYHKNKTKDKPPLKGLQTCMDFFIKLKDYPEDVVWMDQPEMVASLKSLDEKSVEFLKQLLIKGELYREVVYLEKCRAI